MAKQYQSKRHPGTRESTCDMPGISRRRRNYLLVFLTLVYTINFLDRQILGILVEPIKLDLDLSDTQMGFLAGTAFAVFYVIFGLILGRLADIRSRRNIIGVCLVLWSAATAVTGLAQNFGQMFLARVGVGIGEAGCVPPAQSMIVDSFPPARRALAISIFTTGAAFGMFIGFLVGGWLGELFGWRVAFFIVGVPGIVLAFVLFTSVREPPRPALRRTVGDAAPRLAVLIRTLVASKSFILIAVSAGCNAILSYGFAAWLGSFLIRYHDLNTAEAGTALAFVFGIGSAIGIVLGGWLGDRVAAKNKVHYLNLAAISSIGAIVFYLIVFTSTSLMVALAALIPGAIIGSIFVAPAYASIHTLLNHSMRGLGVATFLLIGNLIGIGLGTLLIGFLSDSLVYETGHNSLRYALIAITFVNILAALGYALAAKFMRVELGSDEALGSET